MAAISFAPSSLIVVIVGLCAVCTAASSTCYYMYMAETSEPPRPNINWDWKRSTTTCQWGCCSVYDDPCCPSLVGYIVGGCIAAAISLSLVIFIVCRCCCRKKDAVPGTVLIYGDSMTAPISNVSPANQTASLPPGVYANPPPYDQVMAGKCTNNPIFKPDNVV